MERNTPNHSDAAFRRMRQIEDCLYEMLQSKPYSSVSVSHVCNKLEISRMTFYQYYESKDACFCSIIDRVLREAMIHVNSAIPTDASPLEVCKKLLEFWMDRWNLSGIVKSGRLDTLILDRFIRFTLEEDASLLIPLNYQFRERDPDILAACISSLYGLTIRWYARGCDTPVEEMAAKYLRVLNGVMMILDGN